MFNLLIPPPGFNKIKGFNELLLEDIEICLYQNFLGNYAVVTRDGQDVKGLLCMSQEQANDVFEACVEKAKNKFIIN